MASPYRWQTAIRPGSSSRPDAAASSSDPSVSIRQLCFVGHYCGQIHKFCFELDDLDARVAGLNILLCPHAISKQHRASLERGLVEILRANSVSITPSAVVRFFFRGRRLSDFPEDLPHGEDDATIYYRIFEPNDIQLAIFVDRDASGEVRDITRTLKALMTGHDTVQEARAAVAKYRGINDPKRVVFFANGGMRPGPIGGSHWELSKTMVFWMPRTYAVTIVPEDRYIVIRHGPREFIYYDSAFFRGTTGDKSDSSVDTNEATPTCKLVHRWLQLQVLAGASQFRNIHRRPNVSASELSLYRRGHLVHADDHVPWGSTLTLELVEPAWSMFKAEEMWLLPRFECMACLEQSVMLPAKTSPQCRHKRMVCDGCLGKWVGARLGDTSVNRIRCPQCSVTLDHSDITSIVKGDVLVEYEERLLLSAVSRMEDFRWCLSGACKSGQLHDPECPTFRCWECQHSYCVHHSVPHDGLTCHQYDERNQATRRHEEHSQAELQTSSTHCPGCSKRIFKQDGCNHMTCVCGQEFCYACNAKYYYVQGDYLLADHNRLCPERRDSPWTNPDFVQDQMLQLQAERELALHAPMFTDAPRRVLFNHDRAMENLFVPTHTDEDPPQRRPDRRQRRGRGPAPAMNVAWDDVETIPLPPARPAGLGAQGARPNHAAGPLMSPPTSPPRQRHGSRGVQPGHAGREPRDNDGWQDTQERGINNPAPQFHLNPFIDDHQPFLLRAPNPGFVPPHLRGWVQPELRAPPWPPLQVAEDQRMLSDNWGLFPNQMRPQ